LIDRMNPVASESQSSLERTVAEQILREIAGEVGASGFSGDPDIAKVSLIGGIPRRELLAAEDEVDARENELEVGIR
jgi:hypothetical protein